MPPRRSGASAEVDLIAPQMTNQVAGEAEEVAEHEVQAASARRRNAAPPRRHDVRTVVNPSFNDAPVPVHR